MSVLCEAISVVVPRDVLDRLWPGGVEEYAASAPNRTYCADGHLTRVGFMHPNDVSHHIDTLRAAGLTPTDDDVFVDLVVVDQFGGPTLPCPWIAWARTEGVARAWLIDTDPGELATPSVWEPTQFTLWRSGSGGLVEAITDAGVEPPEESWTARTFEDE
jgi:hypothetical protein